MVKYKRRSNRVVNRDFNLGNVGNTEVIEDYLTNDRTSYAGNVVTDMEVKLVRMKEIVGILADNLNINLASLISPHHLSQEYVVDNSTDSD